VPRQIRRSFDESDLRGKMRRAADAAQKYSQIDSRIRSASEWDF